MSKVSFSCHCHGKGTGKFSKGTWPGVLDVEGATIAKCVSKALSLGWFETYPAGPNGELPLLSCSQRCSAEAKRQADALMSQEFHSDE